MSFERGWKAWVVVLRLAIKCLFVDADADSYENVWTKKAQNWQLKYSFELYLDYTTLRSFEGVANAPESSC